MATAGWCGMTTSRVAAGLAGLLLAGTAAAFGLSHVLAGEPTISGYARVVDGDSLVVDGQRVRLYGIDSPEINQRCGGEPCGLAAKAALERLIGRDPVSCRERDRDRYGRIVATCSTQTVPDLGGLMVGTGNATDYARYSGGRYRDHEAAAKAEKLGIWRGDFQQPDQYRRTHR